MRIMFLNTGGDAISGIADYIYRFADKVDIFCLSEVHHILYPPHDAAMRITPKKGKADRQHSLTLFDQIEKRLGTFFTGQHAANIRGLHDLEESNHLLDYGQATFWRKGYRPETYRTGTLHRPFGQFNDGLPASRTIVSCTVMANGRRILIGHMHGLWDPSGKIDTDSRRLQSQRALEFLKAHQVYEAWGEPLPVIFGGDLNLTSECESLQMLAEDAVFGSGGGVVLNHQFKVTDTRTRHYKKPVREADFVIASPDLKAKLTIDYQVPSDHAALIADIK